MNKENNQEWYGLLPSHWGFSKIGELYSERKVKVSDTEYLPLSVTMKGIKPQLASAAKTDAHDERKLVRKGDFVINSRSDRRGSCGISNYDGSVSLINTILCPKVEINTQYYNWLFHTVSFADEFYKWGHGIVADLWTTSWQDMKKISIPVPPLPEQKRIADFLDLKCAEIDSVIGNTEATIEEYKKLKQSIITEAVTKGIRGDRPMKDSGIEWIGEIPKEWKTIRYKYVFNSSNVGESIDKELTSNNSNDILFYTAGLEPIHTIYGEFPEWKYTKKNDILLARNGTPYVYLPKENAVYSDHIIRTDIKEGFNKFFIRYCLQQSIASVVIDSVSIATWSISLWEKQALPFPPLSEQQEIADYLDSKCSEIDKLIDSKQKIIEELQAYKKSVIYEYVTGKKKVQ